MQQNIASDLAAGRNVTLPRNFNYNTNRQVPTMQLLSKLSKFDGQRKDAVVDTMKLVRAASDLELPETASPASARQEEIRKASTARPAPTVLDPTYKPMEEKLAATEPLKRHNYNYNAHMNATVGKLFTSPATVPDDPYIPTKRMTNPHVSNMNNSLIGGQSSDDMYKTTARIALSGEAMDNKSAHGKKMLKTFEPDLFVSPITGEQIANYGNWVNDLQAKKAGGKPVIVINQYEQDLKELEKNDPVMFKLKSQLGMRGARGVMGLGRLFRIVDDDDSKSLSFGEFKKAMLEFGMALNDTELVVLFKRFGRSIECSCHRLYSHIDYSHVSNHVFFSSRQ
ncbi:hypothetical protein EON65_24130 [archaeon]|nr:MAG: hypothetical protein EON65_24130 [archaeon]